jgi:hypothetical protein
MTPMHAIENADGEKERAWKRSQFADGLQRLHRRNDEGRRMNDE